MGSLVLPVPFEAHAAGRAKTPALPSLELVELRSARTKTIRQGDGSLKTILGSQSFHYQDRKDGKWKEIDATFAQSDKPGTKWESGKNRFTVSVAERTKSDFISFTTRQGTVSLSLEGASQAMGLKEKENRIAFKGALPHVDLEYVLLPDALKENIVLRREGAPSEYRFRLTPAAGQSFRVEQREGAYWFLADTAAEPAFVLLPPAVGDASGPGGSFQEASGKASLDVEDDGGSFLVTLAIDEDWLAASERSFPVTLDPTLYSQPDTQDGEYDTSNPSALPNLSRTATQASASTRAPAPTTWARAATQPPSVASSSTISTMMLSTTSVSPSTR